MRRNQDTQAFDDSHLDIDFALPRPVDEMAFPDLYVGLDIDLLAPGDGIVTDRHHASADRYEADDPQNQIAGQISPFTLSGWLRHACERVVQTAGATACHPGYADADYMLDDVYDRDLDNGYHEKGSCVDDDGVDDTGCVIHDLFGGFGDRAGRVIRRPIRFSPIRRQVDVTKGEAEAHYRQLNTQVRSRNAEDEGQPLRQATRDVVGNLVGTWRLTLRELKPEYVGLLVEAIAYLDAHSGDFEIQLGGARNFGAGIVDAHVVNPLYTEAELRRVYNRAQDPTSGMQTKDDIWRDQCRDEFVRALQARTAAGDGDLPMPTGDDAA
ncbi:hypothetical protein HALDL1_03620 [Halobacterium sp. DL1]|jgi:hypothetical protein|uniref:Uncharacterized protein n=1 Tax=Halorubrum lacusprofundi (strain ATCC 49239 / DSM 5036 / JCM 8891 / ACAM 34) TaxID=416348 RepID=B9LVZ2_HALLT|nr:hypothetical protein [Halorubrum lacusprofundi]ACM58382.1 conserved hypothetical protein [Halorubrum lacusprofundi ATCC 49239]AHG02816.1 hypothetical protein HALDL1_03620 [Halobacterium sp. DL1]